MIPSALEVQWRLWSVVEMALLGLRPASIGSTPPGIALLANEFGVQLRVMPVGCEQFLVRAALDDLTVR